MDEQNEVGWRKAGLEAKRRRERGQPARTRGEDGSEGNRRGRGAKAETRAGASHVDAEAGARASKMRASYLTGHYGPWHWPLHYLEAR